MILVTSIWKFYKIQAEFVLKIRALITTQISQKVAYSLSSSSSSLACDLYEVVSHSTSNSGINGSIPLDVQCISRIQDFQTCSFTFSNSQFSIMQNFLCGIFEIFIEKINSIIIIIL
jgi:hypothetical protein